MTETTRHHFVPRFYLKRFSKNGKRIFVFDKPRQTSFPTNVSNVANQKSFYDLTQELVDEILIELPKKKKLATRSEQQEIENALEIVRQRQSQCVEANLSNIESRFADTLANIVKDLDKSGTFNPHHRTEVSFFVALQFIRTQEHRESMRELYNKGLQILVKAHKNNPEFPAELADAELRFTDEYIQLNHILFMLNPEIITLFAEILRSHIWIIGVNQTPYPLYTSDHPVVKRAHLRDTFRSNSGLASPGIEIAYPLTPKYVLQFVERTYFQKIEAMDGKTLPLNKDNIIYLNSLQVHSSYRQVYSPTSDFSLAVKMCRDHPELTNLEHPRIIVNTFGQELL